MADEETGTVEPVPQDAHPEHHGAEPTSTQPDFNGPAPANTPQSRPGSRTVLAAALAGLLLLGAGIGIGWGLGNGSGFTRSVSPALQVEPQTTPSTSTGQSPGSGTPTAQTIADKVDPAVVDITTTIDSDPFDNVPPQGRAAGTGMIVTASGEVLTNNHVIDGASSIHVSIEGRSGTYTAHVIGSDTSNDVALLQVEGVAGLPTVTLASSSSLSVGQAVFAIGNAQGRGGTPTITQGTITALDRDITVGDGRGGSERLQDVIQTDAQIEPGDSGGALVNTGGRVIGMITAGSRTFAADEQATAGFAISSDSGLRIVNEIRAGHESGSIVIGPAGFLGIGARNLDAATAGRLGLATNAGVLVSGVTAGTPADRAGITQGSVITSIDGERVTSVDELGPAIHRHAPGESITVTWVNGTGQHTTTVELVAGPAV
jgi:S1-C subfamily serine protease